MGQQKTIAFINAGSARYDANLLGKVLIPLTVANLPGARYIHFESVCELLQHLGSPSFVVDYITIPVDVIDSFEHGDPVTLLNSLKLLAESTARKDQDGNTSHRSVKILGAVPANADHDTVRRINKLVDALCLCYSPGFDFEQCIEDQRRILSGDLSPAPEIRSMLRTKKTIVKDGIVRLTPRQEQIYSMIINRGISNKVIANSLKISESAVKLHIGAILKKYGLKNRTQLAVFANRNNEKSATA